MSLEKLKQLDALKKNSAAFPLSESDSLAFVEISTTDYLKALDVVNSDPTLSDALIVVAACEELEGDFEFVKSWPRELLKKAAARVLDLSGLKVSRTPLSVLESVKEHFDVLEDLLDDDSKDLAETIESLQQTLNKALDQADGLETAAEKK